MNMNMMKQPRGEIIEIEEEEPFSDSEMFELNNTTTTGFPLDSITEEEASVFSLDFQHSHHNNDRDRDRDREDVVYVAINAKSAEESSSMDALVWTLTHHPTALVFLVHVFPETKFIPMPCILFYSILLHYFDLVFLSMNLMMIPAKNNLLKIL